MKIGPVDSEIMVSKESLKSKEINRSKTCSLQGRHAAQAFMLVTAVLPNLL